MQSHCEALGVIRASTYGFGGQLTVVRGVI